MKLIIIDDDQEILTSLKDSLDKEGFVVDITDSGQTGLALINQNDYDLLILDLGLPDLSGEQICKTIRDGGKMLPILILSANYQLNSKINLLNLGADDYLIKPFAFSELIARIQALLRRPSKITSPIIKINNLELNKQKQILKIAGEEKYLTKKEFLILEYFMDHPEVVISKNEIMEHVWDINANFFSKTIEMHVMNLRRKIDQNRKTPLIKTVSGRGYKFN